MDRAVAGCARSGNNCPESIGGGGLPARIGLGQVERKVGLVRCGW